MKVKLWGTRGSIPAPGPETIRYGGNTSCVGVTLSDGSLLALDAGTGIRCLGLALARRAGPPPHPPHPPPPRPHPGPRLLRPRLPAADRDRDLGAGLAGGLAARPHRPLHLRPALAGRGARAALRRLLPPLPGEPSGRSARPGSAPPRSPTAARPSATGSTTATPRSPTSPTTSPPSAPTSTQLEEDWISGFALARDASLLIHDGQYTDAEYPDHVGWGHSATLARAQLRPPHRRRAHRPLPPRPAALRRLPRRPRRRGAAALGRARRRRRRRSSWPPSAPSTSCRRATPEAAATA